MWLEHFKTRRQGWLVLRTTFWKDNMKEFVFLLLLIQFYQKHFQKNSPSQNMTMWAWCYHACIKNKIFASISCFKSHKSNWSPNVYCLKYFRVELCSLWWGVPLIIYIYIYILPLYIYMCVCVCVCMYVCVCTVREK